MDSIASDNSEEYFIKTLETSSGVISSDMAEGEVSDDELTQEESRECFSSPTKISEDLLKLVQQNLGLVKLCWSEVDIEKDPYLKSLPRSYYTISDKEKLLAWYAENFRRQFHLKYPERRPLLLMCDNECGIQKFVSTTIRRSTLPYPELYTWQGCGKFISDYIEYEPLDDALVLPKRLCSPTWVLEYQKANSFEFATLLVSLLLGQGYNAYVVSGYAAREQTLCDMRTRVCPLLPEPQQKPVKAESKKFPKYQLNLPPDFQSKFELELQAEEKEKDKAKMERKEAKRLREIAEMEYPLLDEIRGHRVHCWIIILPEQKGSRTQEIQEPIFIEPSTGVAYKLSTPQTNELYLGVESVWNDQNYWVNVQPRVEGCTAINWDLNKIQFWEHLLPGEPFTTRGTTEILEEEVRILQEKHLDMPFSYVKQIHLSTEDFEKRYPDGRKTMFYKKAKVELFAPYVLPDGLIERVSEYDDYDYVTPVNVYEKYANRMDNLTTSVKQPQIDSIVDYYKRGRPDRCKEHSYFMASNDTVDSERIIEFYHIGRLDGLSRLEAHPAHLTQYFQNRDDHLYYRHVQFSQDKWDTMQDDVYHRPIEKIIEKYHRNESLPANKDIANREFDMNENEIRLAYHYSGEEYSRTTRTYAKPPMAHRGERLVLIPSMTRGYNANPSREPGKSLDLLYELSKQLEDEDRSISAVRAAEKEIMSFLKIRSNEYFSPQLSTSPFDTRRNPQADDQLSPETEESQPKSQKNLEQVSSYLKPYLAQMGYPKTISQIQALMIREECLNDFKRSMVDKANNLLHKIEDCAQELEKTQIILTQTEDMPREEEEEILEKANELSLKMDVLQVRLNRHRELAGMRYRTLVDELKNSEELLVLGN